MSYPADPGGNFASDAHRRVQAALANPDQEPLAFDEVVERINLDDHADLDAEEVAEILADLEADGDATKAEDGWKNTDAGYEVLTGPIASDGGRSHD